MERANNGRIRTILIAANAAFALASQAVTVNSVARLQEELANATSGKEIVIAAGTYNLADETAMSSVGHLYSEVRITLRGATGNPEDVVLVGSGNRILYLKAAGNTISDITFKNGNCSGNASSNTPPEENQQGGAICLRADKDSTLVSNCIFDGNTARQGGAVANYYAYTASTLRYGGNFVGCVFTNNTATSAGGAGYNLGSCRRCTFSKNIGSYGNAVRQVLVLDDCDFNDNGNGIKDYGTVYNDGATSTTNQTIVNCRFRRNVSKTYGGALYAGANNPGSATLVDRCLFESNSVTATTSIKGEGGAVYGMTNIFNSTFRGNSAYNGGAVASGTCHGCLLDGNTVLNNGGAVASGTCHGCQFSGNSAYNGGAVASGTCHGCLFSGNSAYNGGAVSNGEFFGCEFSGNVATNGGAATGCALYACTNRFNVMNGGNASECNGTFAKDCIFDGMACTEGHAAFLNCGFDRCRFRNATSGSMFGNSSFVTNSLVENCAGTDGNKIYFFHKVTTAMDMINCTIVSNSFRYFKYGGCSPVGRVVNCLFYGNKFGGKAVDIDNLANQCVVGFTNCVFSVETANEAAYAPGAGNFNYNGMDPAFNPKFMGAADPENPYALKRTSPLVKTLHGEAMGWMAGATDIRGEGYPRLREGVVDIGCYQCWITVPRSMVIIR